MKVKIINIQKAKEIIYKRFSGHKHFWLAQLYEFAFENSEKILEVKTDVLRDNYYCKAKDYCIPAYLVEFEVPFECEQKAEAKPYITADTIREVQTGLTTHDQREMDFFLNRLIEIVKKDKNIRCYEPTDPLGDAVEKELARRGFILKTTCHNGNNYTSVSW
jgi:hypothetical protein